MSRGREGKVQDIQKVSTALSISKEVEDADNNLGSSVYFRLLTQGPKELKPNLLSHPLYLMESLLLCIENDIIKFILEITEKCYSKHQMIPLEIGQFRSNGCQNWRLVRTNPGKLTQEKCNSCKRDPRVKRLSRSNVQEVRGKVKEWQVREIVEWQNKQEKMYSIVVHNVPTDTEQVFNKGQLLYNFQNIPNIFYLQFI